MLLVFQHIIGINKKSFENKTVYPRWVFHFILQIPEDYFQEVKILR